MNLGLRVRASTIRPKSEFALHSKSMQRGVATALALLFSWLLLVPAFTAPAAFSVPACCRKAGAHQCTMHSSEAPTSGHSLRNQPKCPFAQGSFTAAFHLDYCSVATAQSVYAGLIQHPAISPQTEANYRISYDRSRQKRGPPVSILS